jgi:hypothetical protein
MAATREQKRRQQAALRRAIQIIRAERPDVWADAYRRAKIVTGATPEAEAATC